MKLSRIIQVVLLVSVFTATSGWAADSLKEIDELNGLLTLIGLNRVYEMNKGK